MNAIAFGKIYAGEKPMVDLFENQSSVKASRQIPLDEWLHNDEHRKEIELIRSMSLEKFQTSHLSLLPGVTPSGTSFWHPWPPHQTSFTFNDFICVEVVIRNVSPEELEDLKISLSREFKNLYYAGRSTSGKEMTLIFRICSIDYYGLEYMTICDELQGRFGLTLDVSHLNFRHLLLPQYDPNAYFNPDASDDMTIFFRLGRWSNKGERSYDESRRISYQVAVLVEQIIENKIPIFEDKRVAYQVGNSLFAEFGEYGRCFFNQIACVSDDYEKIKCNYQYSSCMESTLEEAALGGGYHSSIGTFFHHCQKMGLQIPAFTK